MPSTLMLRAPACADGMRSYFLPPRFYSTEFPFTGLKLKMVCSSVIPAGQLSAKSSGWAHSTLTWRVICR